MKHASSTPAKAIEKMMRFHAIESTHIPGGVYYVRENSLAHPMQRFAACYIMGKDQDLVKSRCQSINGVLIIKPEYA